MMWMDAADRDPLAARAFVNFKHCIIDWFQSWAFCGAQVQLLGGRATVLCASRLALCSKVLSVQGSSAMKITYSDILILRWEHDIVEWNSFYSQFLRIHTQFLLFANF